MRQNYTDLGVSCCKTCRACVREALQNGVVSADGVSANANPDSRVASCKHDSLAAAGGVAHAQRSPEGRGAAQRAAAVHTHI